jgi:hypothetical protein
MSVTSDDHEGHQARIPGEERGYTFPDNEDIRTELGDRGLLGNAALIFPCAARTGAASLKLGLRRLFGSDYLQVGALEHLNDLGVRPVKAWRRIQALAGPFHFLNATRHAAPLLGREPLFIGLVRDPAARARSLYAWVRQTSAGKEERTRWLRGAVYDDDINVVAAEWLTRGESDWSLRNEQCRSLCGEPSADKAIETIRRRYAAVATTACLDLLLDAIARAAGRPTPRPLRLRTSASGAYVLKQAIEAELIAQNREDQALFDWVKAHQAPLLKQARERLAAAKA